MAGATLALLGASATPALAASGGRPASCGPTDLSVTAVAQAFSAWPRGAIVRVGVTNLGPCPVAVAHADGYVPAGTDFGQTITVGAGTADGAGWSIGALASGASVELQVLVVVPLSFPSSSLAGTAHVSSEVVDSNPGNDAAPYSLPVDEVVRTGGFHALSPARVLDTRDGTNTAPGRMGPGTSRTVPMLGHGGVPASGVDSVVVNVTVTQPTAGSHLTVWPAGSTMPTASSLNFSAGQTVANLVTVKLGTGGAFAVYNNSGDVHVLADVVGWYSSVPGDGVGYVPITPLRLYDSRDDNNPFWPGEDAYFTMGPTFPGSALALNVTVTGATSTSHLRVWPDGQPLPTTSSLNFDAGDTRPNLVVVGLGGPDRRFHVYNNSGFVHVVIDLVGVYALDGSTGGGYHGVTPYRVLDTRSGVGAPAARVGPGSSIDLLVAGQGGVPTWADTVVLNVTSVWPSAVTHHTIWPTGQTMPLASSLNNKPGDIRPNLVMAKVGSNGRISLYNNSGQVDLIADIVGWTG
ncbi:MAG: hypothetical protein U0Q07_06810 [Acidimicrobiales bacterium]